MTDTPFPTSPIDPGDVLDQARALRARGEYAQALARYLWCFDHGLEHDRAFVGVRGSYVLDETVGMGAEFPPALRALRDRRERARELSCTPETESDRRFSRTAGMPFAEAMALATSNTPREQAADDFFLLTRALGESKRFLELYDELIAMRSLVETEPSAFGTDGVLPEHRGLLSILRSRVIPALLSRGDFEHVLRGFGDPLLWVERVGAALGETVSSDPLACASSDERLAQIRTTAGQIYHALLASRRQDALVASFAMKFAEQSPSVSVWNRFLRVTDRLERFEVRKELREQALRSLAPDEQDALTALFSARRGLRLR